MARFYVTASGQAGQTSRIGSPNSGIEAHARGWDVGVRIVGSVDADGNDRFYVYATHGSNGRGSDRLVGIVNLDADGMPALSHGMSADRLPA